MQEADPASGAFGPRALVRTPRARRRGKGAGHRLSSQLPKLPEEGMARMESVLQLTPEQAAGALDIWERTCSGACSTMPPIRKLVGGLSESIAARSTSKDDACACAVADNQCLQHCV